MSGTVGVKMLYLKANQVLGMTLGCHLYFYSVAPANITSLISQEDNAGVSGENSATVARHDLGCRKAALRTLPCRAQCSFHSGLSC